jgi:carboxymethylenebutenolidase
MTTLTLTAADGHELAAFLAEPAGTPAAGIVVIQEIFGVNDHIQQDTQRFADAGYLAIAPHMFDRVKRGVNLGYVDTIPEGREYAMALQPANIMADVVAAATELRNRGVTKIGIVGYCFGGTVSASAACHLAEHFTAAVAYYGGGVGDLVSSGATPQIPLMLHFGELDVWIPTEVVSAVEAKWEASPVHRYDANHGFHCDHRADFNQAASDEAQDRTLAWFAEHLG